MLSRLFSIPGRVQRARNFLHLALDNTKVDRKTQGETCRRVIRHFAFSHNLVALLNDVLYIPKIIFRNTLFDRSGPMTSRQITGLLYGKAAFGLEELYGSF